MHRRSLLKLAAAAALSSCTRSEPSQTTASDRTRSAGRPDPAGSGAFELEETTIAQLQQQMRAGALTASAIVERYLARIDEVDRRGPSLHAILETNPDAPAIARQLDDERRSGKVRGPLHGIPIVIKGNIDTRDRMATTAGSLALKGVVAPRDAFLVERLRAAGAIVLAKTNLSEWANFRSSHSSSGWSALGGQGRNPYALDRTPCGSSSGSAQATAANLAVLSVGTETDGSIVCPSSAHALVGIKPTVGLISRAGIIPIAHSQDTAGPIARTVTDAAILLGALTGVDARDEATAASTGKAVTDYTSALDANGLRGARIGVARSKVTGYNTDVDRLYGDAVNAMKTAGATVIDPADLPHVGEYDDTELTVLLYEFKADLNHYLASAGAEVKTLADVIAFNGAHKSEELPYFGQELFVQAEEKGPLTDKAYVDARGKCERLARGEGIDAVMKAHSLDAIIAPTGSPPWPIDLVNGDHFTGGSSTPAAVAGYPSISVPMGMSFGLPVGLSFIGRPWSEATLIRLAYAFEQATKHRKPPRFLPVAELTQTSQAKT
jgi:amidase